MTPVKGKVTLERGRNLVTWLGPDGWTIDRVVKGIGRSFVKADWGRSSYRSTDSASADLLPSVRRGEALWIDVSRNVNWLQPTGISPTVVFPGGATRAFQERVRADVAETLRFYREYMAVEADFSRFTIYVPKDVDSLVRSILNVQPTLGEDSPEIDGLRSIFFKVGSGGGFVVDEGETLVLRRGAWERGGSEAGFTWGYSLTVHEYTHVLQHQLSRAEGAEPAAVHRWMVEGNADWAQGAVQVWGDWSDWDGREIAWQGRIANFGTLQEWGNIYYYALGGAATNHLVALAGPDAVLDFWRLMAPISFGPLDRWRTEPTFEDAFATAFGIPLETYFASFERSRALSDSGQFLRGVVVGADGVALPYVKVVVWKLRDDGSNGYDSISGRASADGSFSLPVPAGSAKLSVDLGGCEIYYGSNGLVATVRAAEEIQVDEASKGQIRVEIGDDVCVHRVEGTLVGADGKGIGGTWLHAQGDIASVDTQTESDGSFKVTIPLAGSYRLYARIDGCAVYYRQGEAPGTRQQATQFQIRNSDVTGVRLQLTEGFCSTKITGRLLDADGVGIADLWLYARNEDNSTATAWTEGDGSFSITVPSAGVYRLEALIEGCWIYFRRGGAVASRDQATRITIDNRDVTGVRFQLREGQCSTKITGTLLDSDGDPLANVRVWALPENGRSLGAQTGSHGSFAITIPESGQYRLSARIDGCIVYYKRDGVTGNWSQATQISVSDSDVAGVTLQLADGMCELRISGKLLNEDGSPRAGQWVSASGNAGSGGAQAGADGSFSFAVPGKGSYRLSVGIDGCSIYRGSRGPTKNRNSAGQISISNTDVTGIEFRLPENPSAFCD